jgi:hypothetical protein
MSWITAELGNDLALLQQYRDFNIPEGALPRPRYEFRSLVPEKVEGQKKQTFSMNP